MASHKYLETMIKSRCPSKNIHGKKPTNNSKRQNIKHAINFSKWANKHYKCRKFEDFKAHIQDYEKYLFDQGKQASTIHTYLAGCCYVWGIPMVQIEKPIRNLKDFTRSRGEKEVDKRSDAKRDTSPWLFDFTQMVGCRRAEYEALTTENFVVDELGYPCVEIENGKGGKPQLQRIIPDDVERVKSYFENPHGAVVPVRSCDPNQSKTQKKRYNRLQKRKAAGLPTEGAQYIFSKKEMKNKLDLHGIRHAVARRAYLYYLNRLITDPAYRKQLEHEVMMRWLKENSNVPWNISNVRGEYRIRGKNRKMAEKLGLPIEYNRLAVMAVSVFHLSHWRANVTVNNYLLTK